MTLKALLAATGLLLLSVPTWANSAVALAPAKAVLMREYPSLAGRLVLRVEQGRGDRFKVSAKNGVLTVVASSNVAACRGAYSYLRDDCHSLFAWNSAPNPLPKRLPNCKPVFGGTSLEYRHYFNVCTFGYTTVWWTWPNWQREIDWMALHGINMPLAMNGQEYVWTKLFRSFGVPRSSIDKFMSGPAFLPWRRMGNIEGYMGPLSDHWMQGQERLQKKILGAERLLGMHPVVPGFSGFVPSDFSKFVPQAQLNHPSAWAGFKPTSFVDVRNPLFKKIGARFIKMYNRIYGRAGLYLCDTFNEQRPPYPPETRIADVRAASQAILGAIEAGDPQGKWVMQGWLFLNDPDFWKPPVVSSLLNAAPKGRLIVLDLADDQRQIWKIQPSLTQTDWIYNTLYNFGQNTSLGSDLGSDLAKAEGALESPNKGRLVGMGLTPEGIDQNPVLFELMCDVMWESKPIDLKAWIKNYAWARYGRSSPWAVQAWQILVGTIYGPDQMDRQGWRLRPSSDSLRTDPQLQAKLLEAATDLAKAAPQIGASDGYRRDLVDVVKTWFGGLIDSHLAATLITAGDDPAKAKQIEADAMMMMRKMDQLLATRPEYRMSGWIRAARAMGATTAEKDSMETNARRQITIWGGPELYDYANKEWAGMVDSFYIPQWKRYISSVFSGVGFNVDKWETAWADSHGGLIESRPSNEIAVCKSLLTTYKKSPIDVLSIAGVKWDKGLAVGKPVQDSGGTEAGHPPSLVTSGDPFGDYWAAGPAPQWVKIDLQEPTEVGAVRVVPYSGDGRMYTFIVEVSADGENWQKVASRLDPKTPDTVLGHLFRFPQILCRYVRVKMLSNTANPSVHLRQVAIYAH